MRRNQFYLLIAFMLLLAALSGCTTGGQPPLATATFGAVMPTQTQAVIDTPTAAPSDTPIAVLPSATTPPLPTATQPAPTSAPPSLTHAVMRVGDAEKLTAHASASSTSAAVGSLDANAVNLTPTGKAETVGDERWVEINLPQGGTGWVDAAFLTEYIARETFCGDPSVQELIDRLVQAVRERDGRQLEALVSPPHGLTIEFIRGGTQANYTPEEARWVYDSTYQMVWGLHPGSGLEVKGSFQEVIAPKLEDVLLSSNMQRACNELVTGGTTYDANLPEGYQNINFISLHRPGPADQEQNWRTWAVGFDYVDGKPFLFSLNHFEWEP